MIKISLLSYSYLQPDDWSWEEGKYLDILWGDFLDNKASLINKTFSIINELELTYGSEKKNLEKVEEEITYVSKK